MYDLRDPEFLAKLHGTKPAEPAGDAATASPTVDEMIQRYSGAGPDAPEWSRKYTEQKVKKGSIGPVAKYPWRTMPVNGTFQIPPGPEQPDYRGFYSNCCTKSKDLGKKFRCHRYPDGTIEVWRER